MEAIQPQCTHERPQWLFKSASAVDVKKTSENATVSFEKMWHVNTHQSKNIISRSQNKLLNKLLQNIKKMVGCCAQKVQGRPRMVCSAAAGADIIIGEAQC